jgi:hypothetical protein
MLGIFLTSTGGTELGINTVLRTSLRPRTLGIRPEVCACCSVSAILYSFERGGNVYHAQLARHVVHCPLCLSLVLCDWLIPNF